MNAKDLTDIRVAVLATHGFEQSELFGPGKALEEAGAAADVVAPEGESIRGWNHTEWGDAARVDRTLDEANPGDYDALLLPGGAMNPDKLRLDVRAVRFARSFFDEDKPVFAICHAPWLLIEADVVRGRRMTSYRSLRTDLRNAGAEWVDEEVVSDGNLTTSRGPQDLDAFNARAIERLAALARERQPQPQPQP